MERWLELARSHIPAQMVSGKDDPTFPITGELGPQRPETTARNVIPSYLKRTLEIHYVLGSAQMRAHGK